MIPFRSAVAHLLRKIEQGVNRDGWDQPAQLAELRLLHMPSGAFRLGLDMVPTRLQDPVGEYLRFLADEMVTDESGKRLTRLIAEDAAHSSGSCCSSRAGPTPS